MNRTLLLLALGGLCAAPFLAPTTAHAQTPDATTLATSPTLPNGITFVPSVDRIAPRVAMSLLVPIGADRETAANAGWRRLLVNAMLRSAPSGYDQNGSPNDDETLQRAAEALGGQIGATVGDDAIEIVVEGDSARAVELLRLALALVNSPRLSDADINEARTRQITASEDESLDPTARINDLLRERLFQSESGAPLAYALPELGSRETLTSLSNDQLRERSALLKNAPLVVGAAGDLDLVGLRAVLEAQPARTASPTQKPQFAPPSDDAAVRELPVAAAGVFVSFPLGEVAPADAPALRVLAAALSEAREARLSRLLEEEFAREGVESVSAQWIERRFGSELLLSAQADPSGVERVKNALIDTVQTLKNQPLDNRSLERARVAARGAWSLERQELRARAFLAAQTATRGDAPDVTQPARLMAVTSSDIVRVARRYLGDYSVVLILPQNQEG